MNVFVLNIVKGYIPAILITYTVPIVLHQMRNTTTNGSLVMLEDKEFESPKLNTNAEERVKQKSRFQNILNNYKRISSWFNSHHMFLIYGHITIVYRILMYAVSALFSTGKRLVYGYCIRVRVYRQKYIAMP